MSSKESEYLQNVKLEIFIERKDITPLSVTIFQQVEGKMMEDVIGGGFDNQVCLMRDQVSHWLIGVNDQESVREKVRNYINSIDLRSLIELCERAEKNYDQTDKLIQKISDLGSHTFQDKIVAVLDEVKDSFFYTTAFPYQLLMATEAGYGELDQEKIDHIVKIGERLRSDSKYMSIQTVLLESMQKHFTLESDFSKKAINNLAYNELVHYGKTGEIKYDRHLEERMNRSIFWLDPEKRDTNTFEYDKNIYDEFYKKNIEVSHQAVSEITGSIACKGRVSGIVRIINSPYEMEKMQTGDILLSRNTNPSLMPAISRAAAIVTDEGGIACHAAIVSRELNIPCVIGTKVATKVLKDGMEVEVDAENGVIRILN